MYWATVGVKYRLVDPATVVADRQTQLPARITDFDLNLARVGMSECIGNRFTTDAIGFLTDDRMQRLGRPLYHHGEMDRIILGKFLSGLCQSRGEIVRHLRCCPQSAHQLATSHHHLV